MSERQICIFEDEKYGNLYPLSLTHPVFEFKCGHTFLYEKIVRKFNNAKTIYFVREYLVNLLKRKIGNVSVNDANLLKGNDVLFVNGRWVFMNYDLKLDGDEEIGIDKDGTVIYARLNKNTINGFTGIDIAPFLKNLSAKIKNIKTVDVTVVNYLWDLVKFNPEAIKDDFKHLKETGIKGKFAKSSEVFGDNNLVFVAKTAQVHPQVVLDTTHGPVIIDEGAIVYPFTRIEGPACIGRNTFIVGGKIREGSAIGETCRIGGEVEESIIHGFSNKYHEGFLGHAYLGEWVNLGASTQNSDVKNDYSNVQMYVNDTLMDSQMTKLGCMVGDHTKTAIGTLINTGTVVGTMSNVVGGGDMLPKFIPSFCWYLNGRPTKGYGFNQMIESAKRVLERRKKTLTEDDILILKKAYEIAKPKRDELIKKSFLVR